MVRWTISSDERPEYKRRAESGITLNCGRNERSALTGEQQALQFLQAGRLLEAEQLCLEVLNAEPANFRAQNFLGIIRFQQGRYAEALASIGASLKLNSSADALSNYGNVLQALGRLEEALESYDKALGSSRSCSMRFTIVVSLFRT